MRRVAVGPGTNNYNPASRAQSDLAAWRAALIPYCCRLTPLKLCCKSLRVAVHRFHVLSEAPVQRVEGAGLLSLLDPNILMIVFQLLEAFSSVEVRLISTRRSIREQIDTASTPVLSVRCCVSWNSSQLMLAFRRQHPDAFKNGWPPRDAFFELDHQGRVWNRLIAMSLSEFLPLPLGSYLIIELALSPGNTD